MIKNIIIFLSSIAVLIIGVLWYLTDNSYEPLALIFTALIALASNTKVLSNGINNFSKVAAGLVKSNNKISINLSEEIVSSTKKYDAIFFYLKESNRYLYSLLIAVLIIYIMLFISEIKNMSMGSIISQLEESRPKQLEKSNRENEFDIKSLYFMERVSKNNYTSIFLSLAMLSLLVKAIIFDIIIKFIYNLYAKKLSAIRDNERFIVSCDEINTGLMHYIFRNSEVREALKYSLSQAFRNIYLSKI